MPRKQKATPPQLEEYRHPDATSPTRPEAGTQAHFRGKESQQTHRYDSSLSPALDWDGQNPAREQAEALIRQIIESKDLAEAKAAAEKLKALGRPFLNWAGKAERLSFDVPTLPLFIHERLSTKAIVEALKGHRREGQQRSLFELFNDPQHSIADQHLKAYTHRDPWVNRLILGDNLQVMNSLLHNEKMAGEVQMIYLDPPYGVRFGSNFQPFVRKRDVSHGDDEDMTREPEMVQAYRDTWELGLHSYLTYLRDRLLLCRDLLKATGSIFVQISDDNLHHVREVMDEVFSPGNMLSVITVKKTTSASSELLPSVNDFLLWYAKDKDRLKYRQPYLPKAAGGTGGGQYTYVEESDGTRRSIRSTETFEEAMSSGRLFCHDNLTSQRPPGDFPVDIGGRTFRPGKGYWKTGTEGMESLKAAKRLMVVGNTLRYVRFLSDFPVFPVTNLWDDTVTSGFDDPKLYVVQTNKRIPERCILMTTDPGDLVLDPTCGSGTTAYVAEQWGRRWITVDVSRIPLALARQRLLTATFPWYDLKDEARGPATGFVYKRRQNRRREEVGGIVPHVTLKSIANNEPPEEEVLVDRPEIIDDIVRVTGPFVVEATIAPAVGIAEPVTKAAPAAAEGQSYQERMLAVLRRSPRLALPGNRAIEFDKARVPARTQVLSAEAALVNGEVEPVAVVFGPEHGAVSQHLVYSAICEAKPKGYKHLVVIGFAIEPNARQLIDISAERFDMPATYAAATPDAMMGDLLKNMRSSQILSVCGSPEIEVKRLAAAAGEPERFQVTLLGVDTFNPITMEVDHRQGNDVPAWFLCADYDDLCFRISQAFFPRTSAWDNLKRSLKATYEESLWQHLAGATSAPFEAGQHRTIAVKVIDDRGNELMVVKKLDAVAPAAPELIPQEPAPRGARKGKKP